ncbi:spore coat protein U domain-containing protein [Superficieibacter sp.]|uniref:Csu type fimbrial protein n=1 Tax=Superficieibacter sp. TaxID=2303322 RepID=UPI0028AFCD08|nr:spore coat protein U domain-containing protein [Superficieibacter sp.]
MKQLRLLIVAGGMLAFIGTPAQAVTSSGTIGATLTLTNGCLINGSPNQNGINFGTLDFGTHPATFSTLTTQLRGAASGNNFTIQCTTDSYTVQVTGNTNAQDPGTSVGTVGAQPRYLVNTADGTLGVAYAIYSDSGFETEILNETDIPSASTTGGINSYTLYGRIQGGGDSVTVVPGTYTDTINVSVNY